MITLKRWYRSSRNRPALISSFRFLLVAAMTRTSTGMSFSPPTRMILFSCNALSTLACADRLISPISSRNNVPPEASSKSPLRCLMADVNDPFSWPKRLLSISSDGIAAQLTSTKGPLARRLFSCSCLATNSLPVPLSPVIKTRALVDATRSIISRIDCNAFDSPIISYLRLTFFLSVLVSFNNTDLSSAFRMVTRSLFRSSGLAM